MNSVSPAEHPSTSTQPFDEAHFPLRYWAQRWGFSAKTVREWFREEYGPGILRQRNLGRRKKREYTTITVSATRCGARIFMDVNRCPRIITDTRGNVNT